MVIDTTSREGMESALAHLMGVSVPELYQYIEAAADSAVEGQWCFNQDLFDEAMENFYSDMIEQELPDEILFFHLSRRLKGSENEISYAIPAVALIIVEMIKSKKQLKIKISNDSFEAEGREQEVLALAAEYVRQKKEDEAVKTVMKLLEADTPKLAETSDGKQQ